ncbi:MAG: hypothetical protein WCK58_12645, partial [Chloroflexota bacterium]
PVPNAGQGGAQVPAASAGTSGGTVSNGSGDTDPGASPSGDRTQVQVNTSAASDAPAKDKQAGTTAGAPVGEQAPATPAPWLALIAVAFLVLGLGLGGLRLAARRIA